MTGPSSTDYLHHYHLMNVLCFHFQHFARYTRFFGNIAQKLQVRSLNKNGAGLFHFMCLLCPVHSTSCKTLHD